MINSKQFEILINNSKMKVLNSVYSLNREPVENEKNLTLGIEFSYPDFSQIFDDQDFERFFENKNTLVLPFKALIYYQSDVDSEDVNPHLCTANFFGHLEVQIKDEFEYDKNFLGASKKFNEIFAENAHKSNKFLWGRLQKIFSLFITNSDFPKIPEEIHDEQIAEG